MLRSFLLAGLLLATGAPAQEERPDGGAAPALPPVEILLEPERREIPAPDIPRGAYLPPREEELKERLSLHVAEDRLRNALLDDALAEGPQDVVGTRDRLTMILLGVGALGGLVVGAWLLVRRR